MMCPESKASVSEPDSEAESSMPTLVVGYYQSHGPGGSEEALDEFLLKLGKDNDVRLRRVGYRYRDEAYEALDQGKIQYLYDPDWVHRRRPSYWLLALMAGTALLSLAFFMLSSAVVIATHEPRVATVARLFFGVLAICFGVGCSIAIRASYKELRLIRGDMKEAVREILEHPLVLRRAPKAPILHQQHPEKSDCYSAFS